MNGLNRGVLIGIAAMAATILLSAGACESSNDTQSRYSDSQGKAAIDKWGNPKITNFTEYQLAIEVAALRDQQHLVMYAYLQSYDGSLRCYGRVEGYGIPYGTQITPPNDPSGAPVREPNALFMPSSANATWIRVIDETTGKTYVDYVEPNLVVSPIKRPCKPLDQ
jgi:hypothetical protein